MKSSRLVKLVRNPNLVGYWRGSEFIVEEFVRRRRISTAPSVIELLHLFERPRTVRSASRALSPYTASSVEKEIRALQRWGLLVPVSESRVRSDISTAWKDSFAAAYYHFSTRDVPYTIDPAEELGYFQQKASEEPQPSSYKNYPRADRVSLARRRQSAGLRSLSSTLLRRRTAREFSKSPVSFSQFSSLIRGTWSQTGVLDGGVLGECILKTSPSAGARHPTECYALTWNIDGLAPGLYHYSVQHDCFERLRRGDFRKDAASMAGGQAWICDAAFLCVMTSVTERVFWRYSSADAYRLFFLDAGHLAQTFVLFATALGLGSFTTAALNETLIEKLLGLDGVREFPVYLCGAGVL